MKHLLLYLLLTIAWMAGIVPEAAYAQDRISIAPQEEKNVKRRRVQWHGGVQAGMNFTRFRLFRLQEYRGKYKGTGWEAMAYAEMAFSRNHSLLLQLQYSNTNAADSLLLEGVPTVVDITFNLLRFPILFKYTFNGHVRPYLLGGPALSSLLAREGEISHGQKDFLADLPVNTIIVGVAAGFGVAFPLNRKLSLLTETRFTSGLLNIHDQMSSFQFLVGIAF